MTDSVVTETANSGGAAAPLSPRLTELVQFASMVRRDLEAFVASVPAALHNLRSSAERWSIVEHVEHVALIEDSIGRLISSMAKKLRANGHVETEHTSMLNGLDQFRVAQTGTKLVSPLPYVPTGTLNTNEALEKLRGIRERVLEGVNKANGLDLSKESFPHPYFGPMTGYQWLLLIGQHELRHLSQMKEDVQKLSASPTASPTASPAAVPDAPKTSH